MEIASASGVPRFQGVVTTRSGTSGFDAHNKL